MRTSIEGKFAVVTGGTRGIGRAIVESLLQHGAAVAFCGVTRASVERAVKQLSEQYGERVWGKDVDVGNPDAVAGFFRDCDARFGGLDILVNNAGIGIFRPVAEMSIAEWQQTIATNLTGAFLCSREALSRFRQRGGGFIVNISSLAGKNPFAGGAAYNASKFGLNGFSEAMMLDHRQENVRVTYIMPGSVDTEFGAHAAGSNWKIAPEDIAEIVLSVLTMPPRTLISRVEVRPSKPPKS
jgi:3-oxoacyl-[acyl-carrier protein] reductase